jgi:hypothetical protein
MEGELIQEWLTKTSSLINPESTVSLIFEVDTTSSTKSEFLSIKYNTRSIFNVCIEGVTNIANTLQKKTNYSINLKIEENIL